MKNIKYISLLFIAFAAFMSSCDESADEVIDTSFKLKEGGLLDVETPSINYVVGNQGPYSASMRVFQGTVKTTSIRIAKTFYSTKIVPDSKGKDSTVVIVSNTVDNFKTIDITSNITDVNKYQFSLSDLVEELTLEGNAIPSSDAEYKIGDYWLLENYVTTSTGDIVKAVPVKVSVSTRFAGTYKCINAQYLRIGVLTYTAADWPSETVIESVDATTYRVKEYFGAFNGNEWYFQVDNDLNIIYPAEWDGVAQTGNDQPFITCESNASDFASDGLPCGSESNYVELNDENGADILYMTFGYFTAGSGPRTFYQVMQKIVN